MAATFNTPIAGVILAIELLLFEFRARSFIPLVIATTLATSIRQLLLGTGPMFHVLSLDFRIPGAIPYYLVLGAVCGVVAIGFTKALYFVEDRFERLPISDLWHPAIGALAIGRLVIGSLRLGKVKIGELEVDTLRVRQLEVIEKKTP